MDRNPYDRRAEITSTMMPQSGLARPGLAYLMGRDTKRAGEFDQQSSQEASQGKEREQAFKVLKMAADIAKTDPVAATDILKAEREQNPYLAKMGDISFAGKSQGPWTPMRIGGVLYQVNQEQMMSDIAELGPNPPPERIQEVVKQSVVPLTPSGGKGGAGGKSGAGGRTTNNVIKDIRDTAAKVASAMGNPNLLDVLASTTEPGERDAFLDSMHEQAKRKDPYIAEMVNALQKYIEEYEKTTGKPWRPKETAKPQSAGGMTPEGARELLKSRGRPIR